MTAALLLAPGNRWHRQVIVIGSDTIRLDPHTGRIAVLRLLAHDGYACRVAVSPGVSPQEALAALQALPEEDLDRIIAYHIPPTPPRRTDHA